MARWIGRTAPGVVQQLATLERLPRECRDGRGVGHAALGPGPRAVREDGSAQRGVGDGVDLDRRHAPDALGVTRGDRDQRIEGRGLDRKARLRVGLGGQLLLEERRQSRLVNVDDVQGREPRQDVEAALAVVPLGQGLAQALA